MCCIKQMDSEYKKLKDPIYGYIKIPTELIKRVIDTAVFQRLRRVLQTSYAPLFSSAIHNRFVHSVGVFLFGMHCFGTTEKRDFKEETACEERC